MSTEPLTLTGDASDFEIAIRGAAMLDNHLQNLLATALYGNKEAQDQLLSGAARLKTLAFCVGLISHQDYHDLRLIGHIRNRFAHPSAGDPPAFDSCAMMGYIGNLSSYQQDKSKSLNGRAIFVGAVYRLASELNHRLARVRLYKAKKLQVQRAGRNEQAALDARGEVAL